MRKICLYRITNLLSGKIYIGQTVNVNRRWSDHKWLSKNKPEQYIHHAMNKYGIENFTFEVIAECKSSDDANETEKQLIIQYDSRNSEKGYNLAPGGDIPWNLGLPKELNPLTGIPRSEEVKKKISEGNLGKIMPSCSEEKKKKLSEMYSGRILPREQVEKIAKANTGKFRSSETKRKLSESHAGEKHHMFGKHVSQETKKKISKALSGRKTNKEARIKMSNAKLGSQISEETKKKMRDAHKGKISWRKLSLEQEIEICDLRKSGLGVREISIKYNCSITTVRNIIERNVNPK